MRSFVKKYIYEFVITSIVMIFAIIDYINKGFGSSWKNISLIVFLIIVLSSIMIQEKLKKRKNID